MIDSSIALQGRPITQLLNPIDVATQGMQLQRYSQQNQVNQKELDDQQTLKDILKKNTVTDENGNATVNKAAAISDIYKANPVKALEVQKQWQSEDLNQLRQHAEASYQLANQMTPENAAQIKAQAKQMGIPGWDKVPDLVSPDMIKKIQAGTLQGALSAKDAIENQQKNRTADIQEKHYGLMYKDREDARADKADSKRADNYQKAQNDILNFRGNQAVQQANTALTNVSNALSLAEKGKLSSDQLHLFSSELAKLATGGVPGHSEIAALMPNTLQGNLSKAVSFFSNNPTDADAQAFIENNKPYLKELAKNYGEVVDRYQNDKLSGWSRKLDPEDVKDLQDKIYKGSYKSRFNMSKPQTSFDHLSDDELLKQYQAAGGR